MKTLKQIFQLKSISCVYFHDNLKRLSAKTCSVSSFICLSRLVACWVTFKDLCCWTKRFGLLSRIHLRVADQSWQTGPNESALHFEVVFVNLWQQIGKLVQLVLHTFSLILFNYNKFVLSSFIENIETKLPFGELTLRVRIWLFKEIVTKQCLDVSFMCLCRFVALRVTLNNLCCGLLSRIQIKVIDQSWHTGRNESVSHFQVVCVVCWHQIVKLGKVVF